MPLIILLKGLMMVALKDDMYYGNIGIIGKPNVGKSTLINRWLGKKISITSNSAQTTRNPVIASDKSKDHNLQLIDTPGIVHKSKHLLDRMLNKIASSWIHSVDLIIFVIDANQWTEEDQSINRLLENVKCPIILAINKIDTIGNKNKLLPLIKNLTNKLDCKEIIPISVIKDINIDKLKDISKKYLPKGILANAMHQNQMSEEVRISEIIREKVFRFNGQEIPRGTAVNIDSIKKEQDIVHIHASIVVERETHKQILIGKLGDKVKSIGIASRQDIEEYLGSKVFLKLWVNVKKDWVNNKYLIHQYNCIINT